MHIISTSTSAKRSVSEEVEGNYKVMHTIYQKGNSGSILIRAHHSVHYTVKTHYGYFMERQAILKKGVGSLQQNGWIF